MTPNLSCFCNVNNSIKRGLYFQDFRNCCLYSGLRLSNRKMTKTQSASQDPRTNLRKGSLPAIMVPRLSHLMKEDSETRLSIRRSSASSLSVSPNCLKDQICVDTPNPLQALPPSPSVSPRSPRSPSNAELEKERALQRWQAEPGIAKMVRFLVEGVEATNPGSNFVA